MAVLLELLDPEDEGTVILWCGRKYLTNDSASHSRRLKPYLDCCLYCDCHTRIAQFWHQIVLSCLVLSFFIKHFHRFGPLQQGSCKYELVLLLLGGILECWRVPRSASNNRGAWSTSQEVSMLWWFNCHHFAGRLKSHTVHAVPIKTEGSVMGALPICDLPVSMWSTVLQVAEVAGSIV